MIAAGHFTERFSYDAAKNTAGVALEGPGVDANLGALFNWRSTPGGVVQLARGPCGETIALTHDACGRVVERRVERRGFRPQVWRYGWDGHDRLVRCDNPAGETWFYGYDPFGRRLTKVRKLSGPELSWTAARFPGLVPASAREATQLWTWPEAPAGAGGAGDERPPVVGTQFTWDRDVVAEEAPLRLDGGVDWGAATRWHYEPGGFVPLAKQTAEGELLPIVTDHLGTPREMFDEGGGLRWAASYTTWGVVRGVRGPPPEADNDDRRAIYPRAEACGNLALALKPEHAQYDCAIRFQGQWDDVETGLNFNRYRHYDPQRGQYASPDPLRLSGGVKLHGYVERPNTQIDPYGLRVWTSDDPLVADLANSIEKRYPGSVGSVNKKIYNPDGSVAAELDIEMKDGRWIEVKSGRGKGLTADMTRKRDVTGKRGVAFAPDAGGAVEKSLNSEGFPLYRTPDEVMPFVGPKN